MSNVRAWLPVDTAPPPALDTMLAEGVRGWSRRWFAGDAPVLQPLAPQPLNRLAWRELDGGMMLGCGPNALTETGARMLDVPATDRSAEDIALLEAVAEPCLIDLRATLAALIQAPRHAEWRPVAAGPQWSAAIGDGPASLAVGLSQERFAMLVRRNLPPCPPRPLGSAAAALASIPITVGAAVGRISIRVADLSALTVGDILVLDQRAADPVPIAVDGRALSRGRVRVVAGAPMPTLHILDAIA